MIFASENPKVSPLPLLPQDARQPGPTAAQDLASSPWTTHSRRTILGAGQSESLQFTNQPDGTLQLIRTVRHHHSVRDGGGFTDQAAQYTCTIEGPLIRWGDQLKSFVVIPHEVLVLNAVVPLGKGRWYFQHRTHYADGPPRDAEILLQLDDPLKRPEGRTTVQWQDTFPQPPDKYELYFRPHEHEPQTLCFSTNPTDYYFGPHFTIAFDPKGRYGQMKNENARKSTFYLPKALGPKDH